MGRLRQHRCAPATPSQALVAGAVVAAAVALVRMAAIVVAGVRVAAAPVGWDALVGGDRVHRLRRGRLLGGSRRLDRDGRLAIAVLGVSTVSMRVRVRRLGHGRGRWRLRFRARPLVSTRHARIVRLDQAGRAARDVGDALTVVAVVDRLVTGRAMPIVAADAANLALALWRRWAAPGRAGALRRVRGPGRGLVAADAANLALAVWRRWALAGQAARRAAWFPAAACRVRLGVMVPEPHRRAQGGHQRMVRRNHGAHHPLRHQRCAALRLTPRLTCLKTLSPAPHRPA